jgi:hypothetical protein
VRGPHGADYRESLAYEGLVYSQLLRPLRVSAPTFYGLYPGGDNYPAWLALEYADDGVWPQHTPSWEQNTVAAARWIGDFQRKVDERYRGPAPAFPTRRDADFYRASRRPVGLRGAARCRTAVLGRAAACRLPVGVQ